VLKVLNNRYVRLAISLAAALVITWFLVATLTEKQVAYRPVVVASLDIEANTALTSQNLEVRNVPVTAVPEEVLAAIPSGKLAGQKIWHGELLLPPMVKDNPVTLPEPENRIFSIPINLKTGAGIQPGDRVDVFVFTGDKNSHGGGESRLLLSGITVIGILNQSGQVLAGKDSKALGSAAVPAVVEVLVTTTQANLLNAAANTGILSLARYLPESRPVKDVPPVSMMGGSLQ